MKSPHNIDPDLWRKAKKIFRAALEAEEEERSGYLDRESGGNEMLRTFVERLLASDHRAEDPHLDPLPELFSGDGSTLDLSSPGESAPQHSHREPSMGEIVSHYIIRERIGEGRLGVIFRARDIRLERDVVLKFLPPRLSEDAAALRSLIVETQAAAALEDPRISTIFEIGGVESGRLFIAETYWPGETLERRLEQGLLPTSEALWIAVEVAQGLAAAHAQGIFHRQIKPENILLSRDGTVKILNFGIGRTEGVAGNTKPGSTPGSQAYSSPEQIRGDPLDARTDLWSLGAVLYRMLAGRLPFPGRSQVEVIDAILSRDPDPISEHSKGSPRRLERLVATALRKSPAARFQTARALLAEIEGILPEPITSPSSATRQSAKLPFRWPRPATAMIASSVLVGLLLVLWQALPDSSSRLVTPRARIGSIAVLPFINLSGDPKEQPFVDGMTEALIDDLGRIRDLGVPSRTSAMTYRNSEKTLTEIAHELQADAVVEGSVLAHGEDIRVVVRLIRVDPERQIWRRSYDRSRSDLFPLQRELALAIAGEIQVALSPEEKLLLQSRQKIDPRAQDFFLKARHISRFDSSSAGTLKASEMLREAVALEPTFAPALAEMAAAYLGLARFNLMPPEEAYPLSRAAALAALDQDPSLDSAHLALMRYHLTFAWNWQSAESAILEGLEIRPRSGMLHRGHAWSLATVGQLDKALVEIETAVRLDPISPLIAVDRARILYYARRYPESIQRSLEILEIWPTQFGALRFLGLARDRSGQAAEGLESLRKAAELRPHPIALGDLGHVQARTGARDDAFETLSVLLDLQPTPSYSVAVVHAGLGDTQTALDWLYRAYREHSTLIPRMKIDPCLDPLRDKPRFQALLRQVGLAGTPSVAKTRLAKSEGPLTRGDRRKRLPATSSRAR